VDGILIIPFFFLANSSKCSVAKLKYELKILGFDGTTKM